MMRVWLLAVVIACVSWQSGARAASFYTLTTTGTVDSGSDASGVFGTPGANLSGLTYALSLSFDAPGAYSVTGAANATTSGASTGTVTVTVGGVSFGTRLVTSYGSYLQLTARAATASNLGDDAAGDFVSVANQFTAASAVLPVSFTQPFDYTGTSADRASNAGSPVSFSITGRTSVFFVATPNSVSATVPGSSVPEPASWAMLVLGMGAVGSVLRRRRRSRAETRDAGIRRIATREAVR